jgi:hypothetical protein
MNSNLEDALRKEIIGQCKFIMMAKNKIENAIPLHDDMLIWYNIQNLLVAAANISKVLSPDPKKKRFNLRGEEIRRLVNVTDDSPILDRKCRNYFEHFDENIETFFSEGNNGYMWDQCIFVRTADDMIDDIVGMANKGALRNFFYPQWKLTFGGRVYNILPVLNEVQRIYQMLNS